MKVYLPLADPAMAIDADVPAAKAVGGSETILLVEDEEQVRNLVRDTLRREGYKVLDAASAVAARRLVGSHKGPIHLLITDVVMPKEGGRQLAESLVARRPLMKVLFMSGYTDRAVAGGATGGESSFIQKPFTPSTLSRKVREVLEGNGLTSRRAGG